MLIRIILIIHFFMHSICAAEIGPFKDFSLNENCVYEIPIGVKEPTTIYFPGKLEAIEGVGVTKSDKKAPISFSHLESKPYFTVKANKEAAEGSLNIIFKGSTYALKLITDARPFRRVRFQEHPKVMDLQNINFKVKQQITPKLLLGLLDTTKGYHLLKDTNPILVENIEYSAPQTIDDYGAFVVLLDEAIRFEAEDTIVFRVLLKNKTESPIYYAPQSLAVKVGDQLYTASLVDASGIIPPKADSVAYFCSTGKPDGGRAHLYLKNRFQMVVHEIDLNTSLEFQ
jgi:hypothetical protein